jgi:hypothetical protein
MAQDAIDQVEEPSLGELVSAASRDLSVLIRSEVALAKAEVGTELKKVATGGGAFAGAAFMAIFAFGLLSFALAYGLAKAGMPVWAGFAIVGGGYLLLAALLGVAGLIVIKRVGPPERTLRTTKETVEALKTRGKVTVDADPGI